MYLNFIHDRLSDLFAVNIVNYDGKNMWELHKDMLNLKSIKENEQSENNYWHWKQYLWH